jgi:hypothetical protein
MAKFIGKGEFLFVVTNFTEKCFFNIGQYSKASYAQLNFKTKGEQIPKLLARFIG